MNPNLKITLSEDYVKPELPGGLEWVKALRSGEHKKGIGRLCNETTNAKCCLGVLSYIQGRLIHSDMGWADKVPNTVGCLRRNDADPKLNNPLIGIIGAHGIIPDGVLIELNNAKYHGACLTEINDHKQTTFEDIATIIETVWDCK